MNAKALCTAKLHSLLKCGDLLRNYCGRLDYLYVILRNSGKEYTGGYSSGNSLFWYWFYRCGEVWSRQGRMRIYGAWLFTDGTLHQQKIKDTLVGSTWIGIRQLKVTWVCSRVEPQVLSLQLSRTSTKKPQTNPNKGKEYLLAVLQKGNLFEIPRQENGGMKT